MHISRTVIVPALLAVTGYAFPLHSSTASVTSSANEATKPFSEHYTSIVGNGEYTAIAHTTPTPTTYASQPNGTSIPSAVFKESATNNLPSPAVASITPFPNTTTPSNTTTGPLSDPLVLDAIRSDLETYNHQYGPPTEAARNSLAQREQMMIGNLFTLITLLPCEEREPAESIAELVLQKIVHANTTSAEKGLEEEHEQGHEQIAKLDTIVEGGIGELFRLAESADLYWFNMDDCDVKEEEQNNEPLPNPVHVLGSRSPKNSKSKSKGPATCSDGSEVPVTGVQDCPPLNQWQEAQKQDKELRKHLKKKEKADARRDHMRIASTTFVAVSCVLHTITCPMLAVPGVI